MLLKVIINVINSHSKREAEAEVSVLSVCRKSQLIEEENMGFRHRESNPGLLGESQLS